jgi:signal transduction histidine kinase
MELDSYRQNLEKIVEDRTNQLAEARGLTIEVDQNETLQWLRGDQTRLCQCLLNYANNAVKFTHEGTIFLRAKKLAAFDDGVLLRFEVQDTGIGIEAERLPHLF